MNIKIGKSARTCKACERSFAHEQAMHSLVRIVDQMFVREDYCESCWQPGSAEGAYSAWTPRFYDPEVAEQQPAEVFSPLRQVFYDAVERDDRVELSVAYLAAQLLRRQKVFRLIKESESEEEGINVALFTDRLAERLIEVRDPNLTHAELEEGRRVLMERLNTLEAPEGETESAEDTEAETPDGGRYDNAQYEDERLDN